MRMNSRRDVVSAASCTSSFSWMQNSFQQDPCLVAGFLQGQCASGSWNITALSPNSHYTPPSSSATACQCSWAVYNTIQACASCQTNGGQDSIISWAQYKANCTELLSTTDYFPVDDQIPDQTAIPLWATENPSLWYNGIFNTSSAQSLAAEGKDDITQDNRGSISSSDDGDSKKSNVGAIAGGVVGGVIGAAIVGLLAFLVFRKKRRSQLKSMPSVNSHGRSPSDGTVQGYYQPTYKHQNFTPSPGPTLPVSIEPTSYGLYPYDASLVTGTYSPPPDTLRASPLAKNYTGQTMPMVAMNVTSIVPSISDANATVHGTHAHTLSNGSTVSAFSPSYAPGSHGHEPVEGAIQPFILPPSLPEPMSEENGGKSGRNSPGPGSDYFIPTQRKIDRRNPPAYSAPMEDLSSTAGESVEAQAPNTTLSGTTLLQAGSTAAGTPIDQNDRTAQQVNRNIRPGVETDQHGFPIDRKI